jgi:hypothetical protein
LPLLNRGSSTEGIAADRPYCCLSLDWAIADTGLKVAA